jgi:hypothetical protein
MSKERRICIAILAALTSIGFGFKEWPMAIGNALSMVFLLLMHWLEGRR